LKVGVVIRWNNFKDKRYPGEVKPRWFIYLGNSGKLTTPTFAYLHTTTTRFSQFQKGMIKEFHKHYTFKSTNTPFESDCAIDYNESPYSVNEETLENNPNIEEKGELSIEIMKMIYNKIYNSPGYAPVIIYDIHTSYNLVGITGIKKHGGIARRIIYLVIYHFHYFNT
jgi:hypothetical protein